MRQFAERAMKELYVARSWPARAASWAIAKSSIAYSSVVEAEAQTASGLP